MKETSHMPIIRRGRPVDVNRLVDVWLNSVRATHRLLTEADIQALLPLVRETVLPNLAEVWLVCYYHGVAAGFMVLRGPRLDALFIDPSHFCLGCGRRLVEHARRLKGPLSASVNEQHREAAAFYRALGFRSSADRRTMMQADHFHCFT